MEVFIITAKRKAEPKSKTYIVGWRAAIDSLVIEKAVTERSVCFNSLQEATIWFEQFSSYLPHGFTYTIIICRSRRVLNKNMMKWSHPIWSKHIKDVPLTVLQMPFYLVKGFEYND